MIRRGLKKARNRDATIRIFRDADHSLCETATKRENSDAPNFVMGYLDLMSNWLAKRFPAGSE